MKINAINNTNFKGLFVDKSTENGGNWRMEYYPYSWEIKASGPYGTYYGMSNQKDVDILADNLADNEKIYTNNSDGYYSRCGRDFCKDILGTEFYFSDYTNNVARKAITEMDAMSLEDSLRVKIEKLSKFLAMKQDEKKTRETSFNTSEQEITSKDADFKSASADYDKGYWDRSYTKDKYKNDMNSTHRDSMKIIDRTFNNLKEYFKLTESIPSIINLRQKLTEEADKLTRAREEGNLIDISRRTIYDPNKSLWEAIQEMIRTKTLETSKKLVALPHRSISLQEIIKAIGSKVKGPDASGEIIKYVDKLIASRM